MVAACCCQKRGRQGIDPGWAVQVEHIYLGDRKLSVRTSVLEEKATACTMLCCYADELKEGFYPYVEQVTPPFSMLHFISEVTRGGAKVYACCMHHIMRI